MTDAWEVIAGDFKELAKPHFEQISNQIKTDRAVKGKLTFTVDIVENEKTGDLTVTASAGSATAANPLKHKAKIENRQLVMFD